MLSIDVLIEVVVYSYVHALHEVNELSLFSCSPFEIQIFRLSSRLLKLEQFLLVILRSNQCLRANEPKQMNKWH